MVGWQISHLLMQWGHLEICQNLLWLLELWEKKWWVFKTRTRKDPDGRNSSSHHYNYMLLLSFMTNYSVKLPQMWLTVSHYLIMQEDSLKIIFEDYQETEIFESTMNCYYKTSNDNFLWDTYPTLHKNRCSRTTKYFSYKKITLWQLHWISCPQ